MPITDHNGNRLDPDTFQPGSTTYAIWFLSDLHLGALLRAHRSTLVSREVADEVLAQTARDDAGCIEDLPGLLALGAREMRRLMGLDPHWGPAAVKELDQRVAEYTNRRIY